MRTFLFKQYALRLISLAGLGAFGLGLYFGTLSVFGKSKDNQVFITDYSLITHNDLDCSKITPNANNFDDNIPLILDYTTSEARASMGSDNEPMEIEFEVVNADRVFISTYSDTKTIYNPGDLKFKIASERFEWETPLEPKSFDDLVRFLPLTEVFTLDDMGFAELRTDDDIFGWITNKVEINYKVMFCGVKLSYSPKFEEANMKDVNAFGLDIDPKNQEGRQRIAFSFTFYGIQTIYPNTIEIDEGRSIRIRFEMIVPGNQEVDVLQPRVKLTATGISDPSYFRTYDSYIQAEPGLFHEDQVENGNVKNPGRLIQIIGNGKNVTIENPKGWIVSNSIRTEIPENTKQLSLSSSNESVSYTYKKYDDWIKFEGVSISGQLDTGKEIFPTVWEKLSPELQNAYIAAIVAIALGIIGIIVSNWRTSTSFLRWLFSIPRYRQLVNLPVNAHIFQLINGKKISGIIDTFEGKSTFRVFVLTEVREWDKDNWSEVLPTEVRVPQNHIEMYYKAHP